MDHLRQIKITGRVEPGRNSDDEFINATLFLGPVEIGYSCPLPGKNDETLPITFTVNGEKIRLTGRIRPCRNVNSELVTSVLYLGPIKLAWICNLPTDGQDTVLVYVKTEISDNYFDRQNQLRSNRLTRNDESDTTE